MCATHVPTDIAHSIHHLGGWTDRQTNTWTKENVVSIIMSLMKGQKTGELIFILSYLIFMSLQYIKSENRKQSFALQHLANQRQTKVPVVTEQRQM